MYLQNAMRMTVLWILSIALLFCVLAGCNVKNEESDNSKNSSSSSPTTNPISSIQGVWALCRRSDATSIKLTYTFTGSRYTFVRNIYSNNNSCNGVPGNPLELNSGPFTIGDPITTDTGVAAKELNITLERVLEEDLSPELVYTLYNIYAIVNNILYFGDVGGGSTLENRPRTLNLSEGLEPVL